MTQGTLDSSINKTSYQLQTLMNLYNSGIEIDIISLQLDVSKEEVDKIIEEEENRRKKTLRIKNASNVSVTLGSSFYLDAVVDISLAISNAQTRMWNALKSEPQFGISMEERHRILNKFVKSKVTLVILHVELVGSTQLSMTIPLDRLTTIIQHLLKECLLW
ncbi:MAG TPA: hypothetical protein VIP70_01765 [Nitrososphaeraceae archaeon]